MDENIEQERLTLSAGTEHFFMLNLKRPFLLLPGIGLAALLLACGGGDDGAFGTSTPSTRATATGGTPAATPSPSASVAAAAEMKTLVTEAVAHSNAQRPMNVNIKTTFTGGGINELIVQDFNIADPAKMTLRETSSGKQLDVAINGDAVYTKSGTGAWTAEDKARAGLYNSLIRLYDIAPTALVRDSVDVRENNEVVRKVSVRASTDQLGATVSKMIGDNTFLKTNLTQSDPQSIQAEYFIDQDDQLVRHATFTIDAMASGKGIKTTVEYTFTYGKTFSFLPDSPLAGQ